MRFVMMLSIAYPTRLFIGTSFFHVVSCPQTSIIWVMFDALLFLECSGVLVNLTFASIKTGLIAEYAVHRFICF